MPLLILMTALTDPLKNIIRNIHVESNYPANIIKHVSKKIEKCLSQLFSNEELCKESAHLYEHKLHQQN